MSGEDQARTVSLAQLLRSAVERRLADVHTALPGEVRSYDPQKQVVDVQPLVQAYAPQEDGTAAVQPLPVLSDLPVAFPAAGGFRLVMPIARGDVGLIVFSEASLDAWQASGGLVDPGDPRRFHLSDAVFFPGLHANANPLTGANTTDASFGKDGAHQVVITPTGIELGGNDSSRPTDFVALAALTKAELSAIHDSLNLALATMRADLAMLKAHTHEVVIATLTATPSLMLAAMQNPVDATPVQDVKSALVKSK